MAREDTSDPLPLSQGDDGVEDGFVDAPVEDEQAAELRGKWMRATADLENMRRRARREAESAGRQARKELLGDLLEVLDNFDRALAAPGAQDSPLHGGLLGVRAQVLDLLARHGAAMVPSDGEAFDPHIHEAVAVDTDDSQPDGAVLATLQPGFAFEDGDLLRPARVIVNQRG